MSLPTYNKDATAYTPNLETERSAEISGANNDEDRASAGSSRGGEKAKAYHTSDVEAHPTSSDDQAAADAAAAKLYARENGLEQEDERDGPMGGFKQLMHSRGAVIVRDFGMILLLLGWWIPSIINEDVRNRWIPATVFAWFFILLILLHNSRYIPQRPLVRAISAVWGTCLGNPWDRLPYIGKLVAGWAALAVLVFGSTYGLPSVPYNSYGERTISLAGVALIYGLLFLSSHNHKAVQARTTIVGIGLQFIIALFVFRTGAGLSLFQWIATAAADLLTQGQIGGAAFFWSSEFIGNFYFFVNVLSSIAFFVALCVALFYCGALTWCIKKAAWGAFKLFGISGAEAVVAVASPFIGQGENCVLTRPFVKSFTRSEFHQVLVSGFAAIAGSVLIAYINLGVSGRDLVTSSVMSIPASIAASKMRYPETQESYTAGRVEVSAEEDEDEKATDFFHALSKGAWLGAKVAAIIWANVLVIVSVLYTVNGLLTYIGKSWYLTGENSLTLQLIFGYVLWPLVFMLGVPKADVLASAKLLALKIFANEFVAYNSLQKEVMISAATALGPRAYLITKYMLCGFGNIGSMGINIGILSALAPKRAADIVKLTPSALITGVMVTLSSAAIAGIVGTPLTDYPEALKAGLNAVA